MLVRELVRIARLRGFVPVSSRLAHGDQASLWRDRSLLIVDESGDGDGWASLLHAALTAGYPHALLIVSDEQPEGVDAVRLEPLAPGALVAALRPAALSPRLDALAHRAAERARGLPGEFARLLFVAPRIRGHGGGRRSRASAGSPNIRPSTARTRKRRALDALRALRRRTWGPGRCRASWTRCGGGWNRRSRWCRPAVTRPASVSSEKRAARWRGVMPGPTPPPEARRSRARCWHAGESARRSQPSRRRVSTRGRAAATHSCSISSCSAATRGSISRGRRG